LKSNLLGNLILFSASVGGIFAFMIYHGWPFKFLSEMPLNSKITCAITIYATVIFMLTLSCTFYILILRKKGQIGINKVSLDQESGLQDAGFYVDTGTPSLTKAKSSNNLGSKSLSAIAASFQCEISNPGVPPAQELNDDPEAARIDNVSRVETAQNFIVNSDRCSFQIGAANFHTDDVSTSDTWRATPEAPPDDLNDLTTLNAQEKRSSQINAAIKSLETNLILSICIALIIFAAYSYSHASVVVVLSLVKGSAPILTTVANFGKIQEMIWFYLRAWSK